MDHLISKLQAQARAHPSNPILRRILPEFLYLLNGVRPDSIDVQHRYDGLHRDLGMLATEGHWNPSREDEDALRTLKRMLGLLQDDTLNSPRIDARTDDTHSKPMAQASYRGLDSHTSEPIIEPPTLSTPLLPVSITSLTVLPIAVEFLQILNQTLFLHLLATDPQRVLPPGKSLLSMMSAPRSNSHAPDETQPNLQEDVEGMVPNAFWKEALESLSPDTQLSRLRRLYEYLFAALQPLLPTNHPILVTLSLPLSPTSVPLRSAVMHLRDILVALRACASPMRDAHIDTLMESLAGPNQLATTEGLARLVTDTARSILELAESMREDLSQFVLASMEEQDLKVMVTQQAMLREKTLILQLWPPSRVDRAWKTWLDGLDVAASPAGAETAQPTHRRWAYRLVQALGTNSVVTCPLPTVTVPGSDPPGNPPEPQPEPIEASRNTLPPPFFVTTPALLAAQNHLQALVITAALRSLVRLPPRRLGPASSSSSSSSSSASSSSEDRSRGFMERIWTLLKASVDEEPEPGAEGTKIINLADEVVRAQRARADDSHSRGPEPDPEEEARLRAAVDRTLKLRDPVFVLLQTRLLRGLAAWLVSVSAPEASAGAGAGTASHPGVHMQTGWGRAPGRRPRPGLGGPHTHKIQNAVAVGWERGCAMPVPVIKGFEDEVLVREVGETFGRVGAVVDWTDWIWQDLVENGTIGGSLSGPVPVEGLAGDAGGPERDGNLKRGM